MSIQREEAARALRDAEAAADRSARAVGYQRASQYLILWGLVWTVGNVAGFFKAPYGSYLWPATILVGIVGSIVIGVRSGRAGGQRGYALQSVAITAAIFLFMIGLQVVMPTNSLITAEAVMCLAVGAIYMVLGASIGWRFAAVGAALMVAVIVGWLYARDQFFLWLAVAGGGGMILGGLWLRKA